MLTWSDLTQNWAYWSKRIQVIYPHLDDSAMAFAKQDRARFESYLAATHHLTSDEATEALNDFLWSATQTSMRAG